MKKFALIFLSIIFIFVSCGKSNQKSSEDSASGSKYNYIINVDIDPYESSVEAKGSVKFTALEDKTDSVSFLLHKQFNISSITGENIKSFSFDKKTVSPYNLTPDAGILTIHFKTPLQKGDEYKFDFAYSGTITDFKYHNNSISEDWVELGWRCPWYPYSTQYRTFNFAINVGIEKDYNVVGIGDIKHKKNRWYITEDEPVNDIFIGASRGLKTLVKEDEDKKVILYYKIQKDVPIGRIMDDALWILNKYNEWFDSEKTKVFSILIAPRESGGAYADTRFIVYRFSKKKMDYFSHFFLGISPAIARIWWDNAPIGDWQMWLNESFAEYSTIMAVRERYGERYFNSIMKRKIGFLSRIKFPPLYNLDMESSFAYPVLFNKGPVILYNLEKKIGRPKFMKLLQTLIKDKVGSTDKFLEVLENLDGKDIRMEVQKEIYGK